MTVTYADDGEGVSDDDDGDGEAIRIHTGMNSDITSSHYCTMHLSNGQRTDKKKRKGKEDMKVR